MSVHLMCITSGGGLPIFARNKGTASSLPFSTIGSLNGVHMFGKSQQMELLSALTEDYTFVWKEFHDSLVFIGISTGCTTEVLSQVLEETMNAMVMIVGLDEVVSQRNVERLKRELRICYPVIDRLMDGLDYGEPKNKQYADISNMVECILALENHLIQIVLDSFTECVDSMYSCVLVHGKIAAATESWWSLHSLELKLLSLLATVENTSSSKDIPVYLPYKSPNVAFRFISTTLLPGVQVCCLCGPTPLLRDIEYSATQCFKSSLEMLGRAVENHPKNFPQTIQLDPGIMGILLINTQYGKYMISRHPQPNSKRNGSNRFEILRTFYYHAVLNKLHVVTASDNTKKSSITDTSAKETYWCSEFHKCHALKSNENIVCVLYNSSVPIPVMRVVSANALKLLIGEKQFAWL